MPKIKNWSRSGRYARGGGAFEAGWNHDKSTVSVYILRGKTDRKPYSVQIRSEDRGRRILESNLSSFEDARKWAVKWMKANPDISEDKLTAIQIGNQPRA